MNMTIAVSSGLVCQRETSNGYALVGTVVLPPDVSVREGASYALVMAGGGALLSSRPLSDVVPSDYESASVGALVRQPIWHRVKRPGVMAVRLYPVFEGGGYVVYGASDLPLFGDGRGHEWGLISDGDLVGISGSIGRENGMALDQLLRDLPVWPGPGGHLYSLPPVPPTSWSHYDRASQLAADVGDGLLSVAAYKEAIRSDAALAGIAPAAVGADIGYFAYIAAMRRAGFLLQVGPIPSPVFEARERAATEALRAALAA